MSDVTSRKKVSREGIVLIKSFEGFRPRAVRDATGRWTIGYGHTLSAREGATITEADAELLLQYDLIPIVKMVNDQVRADLNQHQFDALVSFALSIGADRFLDSDVARRLNAGALGEAADALVGWPEPATPEAALRRRAAERALFVADPGRAVTLADLMAAPLPPPRIAADAGARAAAVATLLGEGGEAPAESRTFESPASGSPALEEQAFEDPTDGAEASAEATAAAPATPLSLAASVQFQRYSPYSTAVVGPLPGFGAPAVNTAQATSTFPAAPVIDGAPPSAETSVAVEAGAEPLEPASPTEDTPAGPAAEAEPAPAAEVATSPVAETVETAYPEPLVYTPPTPVETFTLTPLAEPEAPVQRPVWAQQQREAPAQDQEPLFEDEAAVISVLRHEDEPAQRRFDSGTAAFVIMGVTGLGACAASAASFRKAMIEGPSGLNDYTMIGWVLAVIGGICVVVSSWNLYVRLARRKAD